MNGNGERAVPAVSLFAGMTADRIKDIVIGYEAKLETERKNISQILHGDIGNMLMGIELHLSRMNGELDGEDTIAARNVVKYVGVAAGLLEKLMDKVKTTSRRTYPLILEVLGIREALAWLCSEFQNKTGRECVSKSSKYTDEIGEPLRTLVFRIAQEIMKNLGKNKNVSAVFVSLDNSEGDIKLIFTAKGARFTKEDFLRCSQRNDLNLYERSCVFGGNISVINNGQGAKITAVFPSDTGFKN